MPVEIRELVLRATVTDRDAETEECPDETPETESLEAEALIAAAVREVFKLLERAGER